MRSNLDSFCSAVVKKFSFLQIIESKEGSKHDHVALVGHLAEGRCESINLTVYLFPPLGVVAGLPIFLVLHGVESIGAS